MKTKRNGEKPYHIPTEIENLSELNNLEYEELTDGFLGQDEDLEDDGFI